MTHKEMTAHIRNRIKVAGIKAKVKMQDGYTISVDVPAYGIEFTEEDQRTIRHIADCNRLTWVRGLKIDVDQMTNPHEFKFRMPA
jgi:hypothetical protein